MTLQEIGLFYNGDKWGVFFRNPKRTEEKIKGNPPKEWYRIYRVDQATSQEVMNVLRTRAIHLEDQRIIPSKRNYGQVFPDLSELVKNP